MTTSHKKLQASAGACYIIIMDGQYWEEVVTTSQCFNPMLKVLGETETKNYQNGQCSSTSLFCISKLLLTNKHDEVELASSDQCIQQKLLVPL